MPVHGLAPNGSQRLRYSKSTKKSKAGRNSVHTRYMPAASRYSKVFGALRSYYGYASEGGLTPTDDHRNSQLQVNMGQPGLTGEEFAVPKTALKRQASVSSLRASHTSYSSRPAPGTTMQPPTTQLDTARIRRTSVSRDETSFSGSSSSAGRDLDRHLPTATRIRTMSTASRLPSHLRSNSSASATAQRPTGDTSLVGSPSRIPRGSTTVGSSRVPVPTTVSAATARHLGSMTTLKRTAARDAATTPKNHVPGKPLCRQGKTTDQGEDGSPSLETLVADYSQRYSTIDGSQSPIAPVNIGIAISNQGTREADEDDEAEELDSMLAHSQSSHKPGASRASSRASVTSSCSRQVGSSGARLSRIDPPRPSKATPDSRAASLTRRTALSSQGLPVPMKADGLRLPRTEPRTVRPASQQGLRPPTRTNFRAAEAKTSTEMADLVDLAAMYITTSPESSYLLTADTSTTAMHTDLSNVALTPIRPVQAAQKKAEAPKPHAIGLPTKDGFIEGNAPKYSSEDAPVPGLRAEQLESELRRVRHELEGAAAEERRKMYTQLSMQQAELDKLRGMVAKQAVAALKFARLEELVHAQGVAEEKAQNAKLRMDAAECRLISATRTSASQRAVDAWRNTEKACEEERVIVSQQLATLRMLYGLMSSISLDSHPEPSRVGDGR